MLGETELGDHVQEEWALKELMSGIARTAVGLVEDGLEAWRQVHVQFEPELMVQQEQVLVNFTAMVGQTSEKPWNETREFIMDNGSNEEGSQLLDRRGCVRYTRNIGLDQGIG